MQGCSGARGLCEKLPSFGLTQLAVVRYLSNGTRRYRHRAALIACFTANTAPSHDGNDLSMSIKRQRQLAQEFAEFGYRENLRPERLADRRNFYKVEEWDAAEL